MSLERTTAVNPYDYLPPVPAFTVTSTDVVDGEQLALRHVYTAAGGENVSPQLVVVRRAGGDPELRRHLLRPGRADAVRLLALGRGRPAGVGDLARRRCGRLGRDAARRLPRAHRLRHAPTTAAAAPPQGDHPHRYFFVVHAVDVPTLGVDAVGLTRGGRASTSRSTPSRARSSPRPTPTEPTARPGRRGGQEAVRVSVQPGPHRSPPSQQGCR